MRLPTWLSAITLALGILCVSGSVSASQLSLGQVAPLAFQTYSEIPLWFVGVALIALTVSLDVIAIGYIIAKVIPSTGISGWINNEVWEVGKTALIIVGIYAILVLVGQIAVAVGGPTIGASGCGNSDPFSTLSQCAVQYLTQVQSTLNAQDVNVVDLAGATGALKSLKIDYNLDLPPVPVPLIPIVFTTGWTLNFYTNVMLESNAVGVAQYESVLNDLINIVLTPFSLINVAQITLLPDLTMLGLGVLIPIGVVMRAFPFIRGIGGTLIAIGIGVSIVYPAVLVIVNQSMINALSVNGYGGATNGCNANFLCIVISFLNTVSPFGIPAALTAFACTEALYPCLNYINIANFSLMTYFVLFVVDIIIVYPVMDYTAKLLGNPAGVKLQIGGKFKV